jgi:CheY-like chemotaxis protein
MPRALLVEDSTVQRHAISGLLKPIADVVAMAHGREALDFLKSNRADVVVSDMQMPDMDGLALTREIHAAYPATPVILITAHGSEDLAVEALRAGACSYVPKTHLAELLPGTIQDVLAVARSQRTYEQLISCAAKAEFEFRLDNDPELIEPLVDLLQQMAESISELETGERLRFGVALEQALNNAMFRGNLEIPGPAELAAGAKPVDVAQRRNESPYAERVIDVLAEISPRQVRCTIRDGGDGYDVVALQQAEQQSGFTGQKGRGLALIRAFIDEVHFNARGNEIVLVKHCGSGETPRGGGGGTVDVAAPERPKSKPLVTLIPAEEGEPIELRRVRVIVGRDRSCDVVVNFPDVSSHHCQLFLLGGWWFVKDLHTKNGIRVNGTLVTRRRLNPGDVLSIARHKFTIHYDPGELGAVGVTPPPDLS